MLLSMIKTPFVYYLFFVLLKKHLGTNVLFCTIHLSCSPHYMTGYVLYGASDMSGIFLLLWFKPLLE